MTHLLPRKAVLLAAIAALITGLIPSAFSATILWTGNANDGVFETGSNWSTNNAPTNTDWQDTGQFNTGTPSTITLAAARNIYGLDFVTAGWTVSGANFTNLSVLKSAGAGTNTINNTLQVFQNTTWTLGVGNTLSFTTNFYQKDKNLTLTGGGTLSLGSEVTGFSGSVGAWGIRLQNATLEMRNNAMVHASNTAGAVYIDSLQAVLILRNSVAGAQALIGGRVRDGLGNGLQVTQIDENYVRITAVPEPGAGSLTLGVVALGLLMSRRRRQAA